MASDEVPEEILKKYGEVGATLYKKTMKEGKALGAKTAKHPLSSEIANMVSSVIAKSEKDGFKPVTVENVIDACANISKRGASDPDRIGIKTLTTRLIGCMLSMPIAEKKTTEKPKETPPPKA